MIKIRAWDASRQTMMTSPMQFALKCTIDGELSAFNFGADSMNQTLPLMLSTACKDNNSTEIYEGDVVSDGHFVWEVYRHVDIFCARLINYNNPVLARMQLTALLEQRAAAQCPVTVIGHIHEDKDYAAQQ